MSQGAPFSSSSPSSQAAHVWAGGSYDSCLCGDAEQHSQFLERMLQAMKEAAAWLRDYVTAIKHGSIHPFSLVERQVREATRNEPWGPTGTMLLDLANLSHDPQQCLVIMAVLQFRLQAEPAKWRNVYKALQVIEYLVKQGSPQCVQMSRTLLPLLTSLESFAYVGPDGKDYGVNVKMRSQAVKALLEDESGLQRQRMQLAERLQAREDSSKGEGAHCWTGMGPGSAAGLGFGAGAASARPHQSPGGRGAGETKGVTMEENKQQLAALKELLARPENRVCADCQGSAAASRPSWASINLGIFICMKCAGIHRGLGVHISKVRSCTLDTWLPAQVDFMARTGNAAANAVFEARLPQGARPHRDNIHELERFIRRKYADEEWADRSLAATATAAPATAPAAEQEDQELDSNSFASSVPLQSAASAQLLAASGPAVADLLSLDAPGPGYGGTAPGAGNIMDLIDDHYASGRVPMPLGLAAGAPLPAAPAIGPGPAAYATSSVSSAQVYPQPAPQQASTPAAQQAQPQVQQGWGHSASTGFETIHTREFVVQPLAPPPKAQPRVLQQQQQQQQQQPADLESLVQHNIAALDSLVDVRLGGHVSKPGAPAWTMPKKATQMYAAKNNAWGAQQGPPLSSLRS